MKKYFFILLTLSIFMFTAIAYSATVANDLQNEIIRLHIIAHSNIELDQSIKLAVRDEVISAVSDSKCSDINEFLKKAENTANKYLSENNIPYRAKAEYGLFQFPQKSYGNITLPAGKYNGVRLILGNGSGRNWWCIMYPPLCISGNKKNAEEALKSSLRNDTYEVITKKPKIRFKIVELLSK